MRSELSLVITLRASTMPGTLYQPAVHFTRFLSVSLPHYLMFETTVLTLGVFANDNEVHVAMARLDGQRPALEHTGKQSQRLTDLKVGRQPTRRFTSMSTLRHTPAHTLPTSSANGSVDFAWKHKTGQKE